MPNTPPSSPKKEHQEKSAPTSNQNLPYSSKFFGKVPDHITVTTDHGDHLHGTFPCDMNPEKTHECIIFDDGRIFGISIVDDDTLNRLMLLLLLKASLHTENQPEEDNHETPASAL